MGVGLICMSAHPSTMTPAFGAEMPVSTIEVLDLTLIPGGFQEPTRSVHGVLASARRADSPRDFPLTMRKGGKICC